MLHLCYTISLEGLNVFVEAAKMLILSSTGHSLFFFLCVSGGVWGGGGGGGSVSQSHPL